jgi:hypothetical protein
VKIARPGTRHWSTDDVHGELAERSAHPTGDPLPDGAALAIASWWQAPTGVGSVLAAFASGAEVEADELYDDVEATVATHGIVGLANASDEERMDAAALHALRDWAERHCG